MQGWPRRLTWNDFQRVTNPGPRQLLTRSGAQIVARVSLSIMFYHQNSATAREGNQLKFSRVDVRVQLNTSQTQYAPSRIPSGQEAYYLQHEQGHMDLMGLFARELEVRLLAIRVANARQLLPAANTIVDDAVPQAQMYAINAPNQPDCVYDQATNHGQNRTAQRRWQGIIASNIARVNSPDYSFRS